MQQQEDHPSMRGFFVEKIMKNNFTITNNKLFIGGMSARELIGRFGSPVYVYDADIIKRQYASLRDTITYPNLSIHYACKANSNLEILKLLRAEGAHIETVSHGEVDLALAAGFTQKEIIYSCGNISFEEQKELMSQNIAMNLDSLTQVRRFGEINPGGKISFRINQGIGAGFHKHTITGGPESKFGIDITQIPEVKKLAKQYNLTIAGIHQHIGSNILDENIFMQAIEKLLETAKLFPDLEVIDFGGGFGVPYKPGEKALDMISLGQKITKALTQFMKAYGRELHVRFEPGRYLVAESGVFLTTVTEIKETPYKTFVGLNAGFNQLIRPAMYGAYQEIVNASDMTGATSLVSVVGNICESSDFFAKDRTISKFSEGDIAAILDSGAYGYSMSSNFNARTQPAEVLIEDGKPRVIRKTNGLPTKKLLFSEGLSI